MKQISDAYIIKAALGAQFEFDGVPSFIVKAIPVDGSDEETIVLLYARCWNEVAFASNNQFPWKINPYMKNLFKWGPLELPVPKGSFFDVPEGWAIRFE